MEFFGITADFTCKYLGNNINSKNDGFDYFIIKQFDRKSTTGVTNYYSFKVIDKALNRVPINIKGVKLVEISSPYWWDLGGFKINDARFRIAGSDGPWYKERHFSPYVNYLKWRINREASAGAFCFLVVEDEKGETSSIPTFLYDIDSIEYNLSFLKRLSILKLHSTNKLLTTLLQLKGISLTKSEERVRLQEYFEEKIKDWHTDSTNWNKAVHHENPEIDLLYEELRNSLFDS